MCAVYEVEVCAPDHRMRTSLHQDGFHLGQTNQKLRGKVPFTLMQDPFFLHTDRTGAGVFSLSQSQSFHHLYTHIANPHYGIAVDPIPRAVRTITPFSCIDAA